MASQEAAPSHGHVAVYRLTSSTIAADAATLRVDPMNRDYWRRNSIRMESQVVRDSLLALAGSLDLQLGGPSIDPAAASQGKAAATRRSLYFKHSRDQRDSFLSLFDDADILSCYRRDESVVPQQALALVNSRESIREARRLADRLEREAPDLTDEAFVSLAYFSVLARQPGAEEKSGLGRL